MHSPSLLEAKSKAAALVAAICAAAGTHAWAVEPQSIRFSDGLKLVPTLKMEQRYDDNIRATQYDTQSSWVTAVMPTFVLSTESRTSAYALTYALDNETYASSHADDHTDHHVDADAGFQFDVRNRLRLNAGYDKIEDVANDAYVSSPFGGTSPGVGNQPVVPQGNSGEPAKYTTTNAGGIYTYGAMDALMQLEMAADYQQLRYQNSGGFNDDLEYNSTPLRATGYYRVAPKTRLLAEVRHTHFDYLNSSDQDSDNRALLGGLTWDATARTSGTVKIGTEEKSYDNSTFNDQNNATWDAGVQWKPLSYSVFTLNTNQSYQEGNDSAGTISSQTTGLNWAHQWMERLSSEISYSYTDNQYEGSVQHDTIDIVGASLSYEMRRWLDIGVGYKYATDDSNVDGQSYNRNIFSVSFTASL